MDTESKPELSFRSLYLGEWDCADRAFFTTDELVALIEGKYFSERQARILAQLYYEKKRDWTVRCEGAVYTDYSMADLMNFKRIANELIKARRPTDGH